MPSTQDLCEKFYGTRDIYEIFEVTKNAQESESKRCNIILDPQSDQQCNLHFS